MRRRWKQAVLALLSGLALLLSACESVPVVSGTADVDSVGDLERSLPVDEEGPGPVPFDAEASLGYGDEEGERRFLTGLWQYDAPGGGSVQILLEEDGGFQASRTDGGLLSGPWRLDRLEAADDAPPDLLCLDVADCRDPDLDGMDSLGEFLLGARTICDGEYRMRWDQANDGDSVFSLAYDTFSPVLSRALEEGAAVPDPDPPRTGETFFAVCWKVDEGDRTVLWLDESRDDDFDENAGRRVCTPYTLSPDADLRTPPETFLPGGYAAQVGTDDTGEIVLLNWASPSMLPSEEDPPAPRFDREEPIVEGLSLGMTQEQVREVFPAPDRVETVTEDSFLFGEHVDYQYDGMELSFYDLTGGGDLLLGSVYIHGGTVRLYNGLRPGFTAEEVRACWYDDGEERPLGGDEPWGRMIYGDYLYTSETGYAPPGRYEQSAFYTLPYGDDGSWYITYSCYTPIGDALEQVDLTFYIDADDLVTGILWSRGVY